MYAEMRTEMYSDEPPVSGRRGRRSAPAGAERRRAGSVGDRAGTSTRYAAGPRPVRPAALPVSPRPGRVERPVARTESARRVCPNRQRTLVRRVSAVPVSSAGPGRRLLAGVLVAVTAAVVVVGLGQLLALRDAGAAVGSPQAVESRVAGVLTVDSERTVWDVAQRLEPAADGARHAELAERIAVANALTSVELRPGQVLWVPSR